MADEAEEWCIPAEMADEADLELWSTQAVQEDLPEADPEVSEFTLSELFFPNDRRFPIERSMSCGDLGADDEIGVGFFETISLPNLD